jgi:hypothetical protein
VSLDPRFERTVLAELALWERRARRRHGPDRARALAQRIHADRDDLLAHLRRVVLAVPSRVRRVAWLHRAREADATPRALSTAGLTAGDMNRCRVIAEALTHVTNRAIRRIDGGEDRS